MDDDDFLALAAAALATRGDAKCSSTLQESTRKTPAHPMLSRLLGDKLSYVAELEESEDLAVRLKRRLACFTKGSISWGLVDDWRPDGTAYKRHGVVITLTVLISDAIREPERCESNLRYIREAIDLVQLVIALDPWAIKKIADFRMQYYGKRRRVGMKEELRAVARGVPWELRLKFSFQDGNQLDIMTRLMSRRHDKDEYINKVDQLQAVFLRDFMEKYDREASDNIFKQQRQELLQALIDQESPTLERLVRVFSHSMLHAEFLIDTQGGLQDNQLVGENFFTHLTAFASALDRYQRNPEARRWRKHAPFRVEKIIVELGEMHITPHILPLAKALMKSRIPVQLARLRLDMMLVSCHDGNLRTFLQVITEGATDLVVTAVPHAAIDAEGQDRTKRIRAFVEGIAAIKSIHTLEIGGLFRMCTSGRNRQALWRGLLDGVLSRHEPLEKLTFRASDSSEAVWLSESDKWFIEGGVLDSRNTDPQKKVRVKHLDICFDTSDMRAVLALVGAFDEVEQLSLKYRPSGEGREYQDLSAEGLVQLLRWPGLRYVQLSNVTVPTMDVFNPAVPDTRLPNKPVLRELDLSKVVVEDAASLPRFFDQLKQGEGEQRPLADALEILNIETDKHRAIFETESFYKLYDVFTTNTTLQFVGIRIPTVDPDEQQIMHDFMYSHSGHRLPRSHAERHSGIAMARKTAFLSVIFDHHGNSQARFPLDSILVSKIFALSASHATRTTCSGGLGYNY